MARIRTIKPGFFTSEDVACLSIRARLTWIGLWTYADDNGRGKDNTRLIKAALYPLDDFTLHEVDEDMAELENAGRIIRYEVGGAPYFQIVAWEVHQRIQRPTASRIPAPIHLMEDSVSPHGGLREDSMWEGKGREGTRSTASEPPAPRCATHLDNPTDEPCRAGGRARKAAEAWKPQTPTPPPLSQVLHGQTCEHGAPIKPPCALCRKGVPA